MNQQLKISSLLITFLIVSLVIYSPIPGASSTSSATLLIKIYRIKLIDKIESQWLLEDGADWHYHVLVWDGAQWLSAEGSRIGEDDWIVNTVHSFEVNTVYPAIRFQLLETDTATTADVADISGFGGFGPDNTEIVPRGAEFWGIYDLTLDSLHGDEVRTDGEYFKTSGEYDGSVGIDENDAEIWFSISDNYDTPVANAGPDQSVDVDESVNFDGSGSTASDGSSLERYEWDFNNDGLIDAEGQQTSHTYTEKGEYIVSLKVTDSIGVTNTGTCTVTVNNKTPTAVFSYSPDDPTIRNLVNFYDTSVDPDGTIVSWYWNFGDGDSSTNKNPTYNYTDKGVHTVTLTVTDNDGESDSTTGIVTVINLPPIAKYTYSPTNPRMGKDVEFVDESIDPEGKTLFYSWDFGDGYTSTQKDPTHQFQQWGTYSVKISRMDDEGEISITTKSIKINAIFTLTVDVKDLFGFPVYNSHVKLYSDENPNDVYSSRNTDTYGKVTLPEILEGTYQLTVSGLVLTESKTVHITESYTEWFRVIVSVNVIGIVGGSIGIIGVVGFLMIRRRKKSRLITKQEPSKMQVLQEDSPEKIKVVLEKERISEMLRVFKEKFDKGEIDQETYFKLKKKYDKELQGLEEK